MGGMNVMYLCEESHGFADAAGLVEAKVTEIVDFARARAISRKGSCGRVGEITGKRRARVPSGPAEGAVQVCCGCFALSSIVIVSSVYYNHISLRHLFPLLLYHPRCAPNLPFSPYKTSLANAHTPMPPSAAHLTPRTTFPFLFSSRSPLRPARSIASTSSSLNAISPTARYRSRRSFRDEVVMTIALGPPTSSARKDKRTGDAVKRTPLHDSTRARLVPARP